tara:strand:- start:100 stop:1830 length:1731 start_codon:yes stop_codon:yes gene_type:complete
MANGFATSTISLPDVKTGFDSKGTAIVPVTVGRGEKKIGKIEIKSPMEQVTNFFAGIDKSLIDLVKFAKASFGLEEKESKRKDEKFIGPMPSTKMIRTGRDTLVDTDDEVDPDKPRSGLKDILETLKDSFDKVSFGEVLTATLLAGGLALFLEYREAIEKALYPFVVLIKGIVDLIGVKGTLAILFGTILTIKLLPVIKAAKDVVKYLGGFLPSFKTLKRAFRLMRVFIKRTLPLQLKSAYQAGKFTKALKLLSGAFTALRLMLTATLYPAIISMVTTLAAAMGPILGPVLIIGAIAAGIAAVLFSIKSGFEVFKKSLDDGDSMLVAIGKGIADFALTLATLPITLIKKVIGYIAGLFGFDGIKEALDKFSFKDLIKNSFIGFVTSFVRVIKAIAKGAAAALAAIAPGGKTPQGEFSRVYNEVMTGGQGEIKVEKTDLEKTTTDGQPELTETKVADAIVNDEITLDEDKKTGMLEVLKSAVVGDRYIEGTEAYNRKIEFEKNQELKREKAKTREIEQANLRSAKKLDPEAMYAEITDNSSKIINKTEIVEAPIEVNNNEAFNRLINSLGGRYGNPI